MPSHHRDEPTPEQATELQTNFDASCQAAAKEVAAADVVLFVTGAGWGADSGLAVYGDIAKVQAYRKLGLEYHDLSQPGMLERDPALFYGFRGQSFNDYRKTQPHAGYDIISRWRHDKNQGAPATKIRDAILEKYTERDPFDAEETQRLTPYDANNNSNGSPCCAGAFHAYTSNVDAHFYDKLPACEIHDCHGSIELWQCANRDCDESGIWRAPVDHLFTVDPFTMLAPEDKNDVQDDNDKNETKQEESTTNETAVPVIGHTQGRGERTDTLKYMPEGLNKKGWSLETPNKKWKETVLELSSSDELKVCILEVGCGTRITNTRNTSEEMVEALLAQDNGQATLIPINPDFPLISDLGAATKIPIMSRGLRAISWIDEYYRGL